MFRKVVFVMWTSCVASVRVFAADVCGCVCFVAARPVAVPRMFAKKMKKLKVIVRIQTAVRDEVFHCAEHLSLGCPVVLILKVSAAWLQTDTHGHSSHVTMINTCLVLLW